MWRKSGSTWGSTSRDAPGLDSASPATLCLAAACELLTRAIRCRHRRPPRCRARSPPMSSRPGCEAGPVVLVDVQNRRLRLPQRDISRVRPTSTPRRSAPRAAAFLPGCSTPARTRRSSPGWVFRSTGAVVIYSAGETRNIDATFLAWLLAGFGHAQVFVLDGGFFKWQLEQRPVVGEYPRLAETRFPAEPFRPEQASLEDVQRALRSGGAILVDARPPDQYAGEAGAQMRHGHIPGAINHYWQDDLALEGFGYVWKPRERAARELCGAGHHAGQGHHRLLQQRHRGEPRALHAEIPAGVSPGADLRGLVDGVGGAEGPADRSREA